MKKTILVYFGRNEDEIKNITTSYFEKREKSLYCLDEKQYEDLDQDFNLSGLNEETILLLNVPSKLEQIRIMPDKNFKLFIIQSGFEVENVDRRAKAILLDVASNIIVLNSNQKFKEEDFENLL